MNNAKITNSFCYESANGLILKVRLCPGAKKEKLIGIMDDRLKISVASPPVKGAANKGLILYLAGLFKVKKSKITLLSGNTSRMKTILLAGAEKKYVFNTICKELQKENR